MDGGTRWQSAADSARATRIATAFGASLTNWHLIAVDKNHPGVVIDEAGQRFLYQAVEEEDEDAGGGGLLRPGSSAPESRRLTAA